MNHNVSKTTLANGVRIISKRIPHSRSISMGIWVNAGARDERFEENGLSHFIEHMIFKGTNKRNAYQIAKEFDSIGGYNNAFTTMENTCYHAKVMDNHFGIMVDILSDIFLNSIFLDEEIEKEKPVIIQEISMVEDSPEDYVHLLSTTNAWIDHPLGRSILGTRENISNFNSKRVKKFFTQLYQPERIVLSAAGNIDHSQLLDAFEKSFSQILSSSCFPDRSRPQNENGVNVYPRDIEQAHLCLTTKGLPIFDERRYAFSLLNTTLGGNMSSILFQEIREQRGLAYSVYSFTSAYTDTGILGIYAGVDPKKMDQTIAVILSILQQFKNRKISESKLKKAKEYTKGSLMLTSESIDNQMVRIAQNEIHFGRDITFDEVIKRIDQVSVDEIFELAQAVIEEKALSLTLLGPVSEETDYSNMLFI